MRRMFYGLLAGALVVAPCAWGQQCASEADQSVFELQALKSSMMVLATGCPGADSDYNAFVSRYKPQLGANEQALSSYFKRSFGRSGQREQDAYVTNLANAQSQNGIRQGTDFCPRTSAMFKEVMALRTGSDLPEYAAGKDLIPTQLGACVAPTPVAARTRTRAATTHKGKKHGA